MAHNFNDNDIRQYIQMLQDTINRMASNSSSCKSWMLTLVTALLALYVSANELRQYVWLIVIPVFMFWGLDFYYLLLENRFRNHEKEFVRQVSLSDDSLWRQTIFSFKVTIPSDNYGLKLIWKCVKSPSILCFYPVVLTVIVLVSMIITPNAQLKHQDLETPLKTIALKQDSISNAIKELTVKYQPIQVQSKTFHNSSFFQADNIDSVQVTVVNGTSVGR